MLFAAGFVSSVMTAVCVIFSTSLVPDDTMRLLCVGGGAGWMWAATVLDQKAALAQRKQATNHQCKLKGKFHQEWSFASS